MTQSSIGRVLTVRQSTIVAHRAALSRLHGHIELLQTLHAEGVLSTELLERSLERMEASVADLAHCWATCSSSGDTGGIVPRAAGYS